jgi:hypothetical protein
MVERILTYSKGKGTFLLDAYYDIASYLDFLMEKRCSFIIRAKRNRLWFDVHAGVYRKLKEFDE